MRDVGIRLRWDQAGFNAQVKQAATTTRREFESASKEIGSALKKGVGAGFDAAKKSLGGLGGQIKNVLGSVATLGGAVSLGEFVRRAVVAEEQAGAIALQLRRMGEDGAQTGDVLAFAVDKARALNLATAEVTASYAALLDETGDPVFSKEALASVAQYQQAFRLSNEEATNMVGALRDGLGASTDQLKNDFAPALRDAIAQGGVNAQQLAALAPSIVKTMTTIGSEGGAGFTELVGLINMTEGALGGVEAALPGVGKLLLALRTPNLGKMGQKLGITLEKDASGVENLQKIMGAKGGLEALEKAFGKSAKTAGAFRALMMGFEDAQAKAIADGKKPAEARRIAAEEFSAQLARMTQVTSSAADVEADAASKVDEKGEKLRLAIDRMASAFTKPAILDSMDKLADKLPVMADAFVMAVDTITEHPLLSVAGAVAVQGGAAAAGPMALSLLKSWLLPGRPKGEADAIGGAPGGESMNVASMTVASMTLGPLATAGQQAAEQLKKGAAEAGTGWRADARAAGLNFSTAAGVAAAALAGWQVGSMISEHIVEPAIEADIGVGRQERTMAVEQEARRALNATSGGDILKNQQAALEKVRAERKSIREGGSVFTDVFGTAASAFSDTKSPAALRADQEAQLIGVETELQQRIAARIKLEERAARSAAEMAKGVESVNKATRGVRRPANPLPGSEAGS